MKKYRLLAVAMLFATSTMFISSPGYSTSQLPQIGDSSGAFQQQSCPAGGGFGCFGSVATVPMTICGNFMRLFLGPAAR